MKFLNTNDQIKNNMDYNNKIQIHNFVLFKHRVDKTSFIKVSTVAGDWSVSYREDNIMFLTIDMADESQYEGLYNVLVGMYGACNTVDVEFTKDLFDALNRFYERLKAAREKVSAEDDAKALNEEKSMYELKERMENGHGKDNRRDALPQS